MAPTPPVGKLELVNADGSNEPQFDCAPFIEPADVTLQHMVAITPFAVAEHPFTSVTVTSYDPGVNPITVDAVDPLLHTYVNGAVPPFTKVFMFPSAKLPKQVACPV